MAINDPLSQYTTVPYSTIQYNKITQIKQRNTQHSRQPSIRKIRKKNQEHILYTFKTPKRVEPEVDASQSSKIIEKKIENVKSEISTE